jgi:hypothetical protein
MILGPSKLRNRNRNKPRPEWKVALSYLEWLRKRPCGKGMSTKAADCHALPLCQRHHDEQGGKVGSFRNRGGWPTFQLKYGFNAVDVADAYWRAWPGRFAWEQQLEAHNGR